MKLEYIVKANDNYKIVKDVLISNFKVSHRLLITLKKENSIFLNNSPTFIYKIIKPGDKISISFDYEEDNSNIVPKKMNLDIIYEDECYLVINKPFGIPVHPSVLHYDDSLSNGIAYYFNSINLKKKIRPVIRIDNNTSGLVIFAKNEYVQECLIRQMENNTFKKEYIAIVEGLIDNKKGTINAPIARKENSIIERCVSKNGSHSITHYEVLEEKQINNIPISIIKCILETGRTHQIRVHMSYINHPLIGDDLYNGNKELLDRQALHSHKISFIHPITNKIVNYEASLPRDFLNLIT